MSTQFYQPQQTVTGPAYSKWFTYLATTVTIALAAYAVRITTQFPLANYGFGIKALLVFAALMLLVSYYWFLKSTTTIHRDGITQTWMYDKQVRWDDVRSAKMIGIPFMSWIFPPRLIVRTGISFTTFNGGNQALLVEFARISLAYQMKT